MANQIEIEDHYDTIGSLHALRLKDDNDGFPDYTCAFFDGDFSKTLKQAQEDKHDWIFEGLGLGQDLNGKRILDIGCGWGPIVHAIKKRGGEAVGLTLSSGQVEYCQAQGLDVRLMDYKDIHPEELGTFDAIISVGAFEHFCSGVEYKEGRKEEVYKNFFNICSKLLVPNGRLYLQTMTWGKDGDPDLHKIETEGKKAQKDSVEAIIWRMMRFYPGSWLPTGLKQIQDAAVEYFDFIKTNNGRLDYLETLKRWADSTKNLYKKENVMQTLKLKWRLLMRAIVDPDTRVLIRSLFAGDQSACFRREIMSHERMFYQKK